MSNDQIIQIKPFAETTLAEREKMTSEEILAYPPEERRACGNCGFLIAYTNWWCSSKEAVEVRGTSIPGVCLCEFWKPDGKCIRAKKRKKRNERIKLWFHSLMNKKL